MLKQFIRLLPALMIALLSFNSSAQTLNASWEILPRRGTTYQQIVETPQITYFLTGNSLFSLNSDNELYFYSVQNKLSDSGVELIQYNWEKKYLVVAYQDGNIDLIYDDGRVVNLPDIRDAVLTVARTIRHISFGPDMFIASTMFGFVVFSDERYEVIESAMLDGKVDYTMVLDDQLVMSYDNKLYNAPLEGRHNRLDRFTLASPYNIYHQQVAKISDTKYAFNQSNMVGHVEYNKERNVFWVYQDPNSGAPARTGKLCEGNGEAFFLSNNAAVMGKWDNDGVYSEVPVPDTFKNYSSFSTKGLSSVWNVVNGVISKYDLTSGTPTVLMADFIPEAVTTMNPINMLWSADNSQLYLANNNYGYIRSLSGISDFRTDPLTVDLIADNSITDVSPIILPESGNYVLSQFVSWQKTGKTNKMVGGIDNFAVDAFDNTRYYVANALNGLYVVKDSQVEALYTHLNSPLPYTWGVQVKGVAVDSEGNLWVTCLPNGESRLYVLPHSETHPAPMSEWKSAPLPENVPAMDQSFLFTRDNKYLIITGHDNGVYARFLNGTLTNLNDDRSIQHLRVTDQTGASLELSTISSIVEDHNGQIWVGTSAGVMMTPDPANIMDPSFRWTRPIVPRNDGTNYGDYLLETDVIYDIAVDHSNRKWIATEASGLYLVSADGTEILEHFTMDNSPLASNMVYRVSQDPNSNKIYLGTPDGIYIYHSDASPAAEDFSEVYAYPNPVRPDYHGWITITGLMDSSLVKITDSNGNLVFQGTSEGGSLMWDGNNMMGHRVRTGVYFIFAESNDGSNTSAAVSKIMFVN